MKNNDSMMSEEEMNQHMSKAHPGFQNVAKSIASKGNYSLQAAKAILAAKTRAASPAAKKANPNLKRVKG